MQRQLADLGPTITSLANEKVKYARTLDRRRVRHKERRFIIEGIRLLEDALKAGCVPASVFFVPGLEDSSRAANLLREAAALTSEVYPVAPHIIESLTDTVTPQGLLAVLPFPALVPRKDDLLLVLDGVQDPGNLGTLLRSAEAAGVDQVICTPRTVDAFNPKVVRAGAGAHFRLPLGDLDWPQVRDRAAGKAVRLAEEGNSLAYYQVDWCQPAVLIVSNEGAGPGREARALAAERVAVPMHGGTESLNVAVAASIILFEAARQRATARSIDPPLLLRSR